MGFRLSKLYTRTGDEGQTGLADGRRIDKDHPRIEAMGSVDELNSVLGMLIADLQGQELSSICAALAPVQHRLFDLGGELAVPGHDIIGEAEVQELEALIDSYNADRLAVECDGANVCGACQEFEVICDAGMCSVAP